MAGRRRNQRWLTGLVLALLATLLALRRVRELRSASALSGFSVLLPPSKLPRTEPSVNRVNQSRSQPRQPFKHQTAGGTRAKAGGIGGGPAYNVLLIICDDLRASRISDGSAIGIHAFNTSHDTHFHAAFATYALCNPSRASILTGRRPQDLGVLDLDSRFAQDRPDGIATLPQLLSEAGWHTIAAGKVFHGTTSREAGFRDVISPSFERPLAHSACSAQRRAAGQSRSLPGVPRKLDKILCAIEPGKGYVHPDEVTVRAAKRVLGGLGRLAPGEARDPFFMAVGLVSTHIPYMLTLPAWNREAETLTVTVDVEPERSDIQAHEANKLGGATLGSPPRIAELRAIQTGYEVATKQVESHVMSLLAALRDSGLENSTAVVFTSDHGFALGEGGHVGKRAVDEPSTRVPLVIRCPWCSWQARNVFVPVSLQSVYRTVADLAGVSSNFIPQQVGGSSLVDHMRFEPEPEADEVIISQVVRCGWEVSCPTNVHPWATHLRWIGLSARSRQWRYSVWLACTGSMDSTQLNVSWASRNRSLEVLEPVEKPKHATLTASGEQALRDSFFARIVWELNETLTSRPT